MRKILVTGAAGFIGFHLSQLLMKRGESVVGLDNLNSYYDVTLKESRLALLEKDPRFRFVRAELADRQAMEALFAAEKPEIVVHLAAQAGVRYSLENPHAYVDSNLVGFMNVLEGCRRHQVRHLVFASSSSVYGGNTRMPFSVHDNVDHPVSLYAATKKANELMAHSYAALYALPCTGLRFFTVYGPWGRPDMALFLFTRAILEDRPIDIFNEGQMKRDFTYIDDIVEGVTRVMARPPAPDAAWNGDCPDPATSFAPYRIYNIGNHQPAALMDFISILEGHLGRKAKKNFLPMQAGDVPATFADVEALRADTGFAPQTPLATGIGRFVAWYREYYRCPRD
ncbi:MAG: NAD-dependent epimerase [Deltaproteobacteria bacterium]|nr:NAD-dependent epimerase [Deltaproteobacteria bacterium]